MMKPSGRGLPSVPGAKEVFPVSQDEETEQLWGDVEKFLSRPGPSLKSIPGPPKTLSLPTLKAEVQALKRQGLKPPKPASGRSKVKRTSATKKDGAIDPTLLQQAFDYSASAHHKPSSGAATQPSNTSSASREAGGGPSLVARNDPRTPSPLVYETRETKMAAYQAKAARLMLDGGDPIVPRGGGGGEGGGEGRTKKANRSSSAPGSSAAAAVPKKKRGSSGKAAKAFGAYAAPVLGPTASSSSSSSKRNSSGGNGGWNSNTDTIYLQKQSKKKGDGKLKKKAGHMDKGEMERIAADLASGATVAALRQQLEASQQSLAKSNAFLKQASEDWLTDKN